jgi:hypothetical protein
LYLRQTRQSLNNGGIKPWINETFNQGNNDMKKYLVIAVGLIFLFAMGCGDDKIAQAQLDAQNVAADWLELVDTGQYEESWHQTAAYFRNAVPKEKWLESMQALREPLGRNLSRDMQSARYTTTLHGAPDGEYVVIKLESSFENKEAAKEIITPMLVQGKWKVVGYYLK